MLSPIFCIRESNEFFKWRAFVHSPWTNVQARVHQRSILGPLFFLIYINDLSHDLTSNPKLFADDTSLFSVLQNINSTANDLNSDLIKISD